ncbi:cytidine deaminase [Fulvivirga sp. RKSG066]|uniref:cytidine deaminase n=1 Tax=Fulvivirga aurantia TaxID=2529383 RepID=UPI0012BB88C3|nr:cytidine deaminase [Fulvivirga aurantia]MTI19922.1 cytidine deaminase [Fulvivirga aurantia]
MLTKTLKNESYTEYQSEKELPQEDIELLQHARDACKSSYSPYSNFQVGVAVRLGSGKIVRGSNQENAAYPSGLCAERVALFHVGSNYPNEKILQIAVAAKRAEESEFLPVTPCGSCRQVMLESENKQDQPIEFIMRSGKNSWIKTQSCKILLPFSFDASSL